MSQQLHPTGVTANGGLPQVPEKAIPRGQEEQPPIRTSEDSDRKRLLRNSYQSTHTVVPSIAERPSEEFSDRGQTTSPSKQQVMPWQPMDAEPQPRTSVDIRPPGPGTYGRSTSNDYTVYNAGGSTPTPADPHDPYHPSNAIQYRGNDSYFHKPMQRAGMNSAMRDTTEAGSVKSARYTPLGNGHQPRKSLSRAHFHNDGYASSIEPAEPAEPAEPDTPQKPAPLRKRGTSIYIVRDGGGDDDGSPPPGDFLRLPLMGWLKGPVRNHFVAVLGEFVGTTMFLFFAFAGTVVANVGAKESANSTTTTEKVGFSPIVTLYVSVAFGFSLMVNVWIFFRVSGGLFNPAVTLGMVMTNTIDYIRGFLLVGAQLVGAIFASFLTQVLFPAEYNVRTTLSTDTSIARGVFIEAMLTAELVFTVFMLAKEKHKATYMAPVGIGLALFVAELVGVFFTGGSLNPARSFGPCVTTGMFDPEHWIYWVGPAIGAIAAVAFYRFIKVLEYEMANPGQDDNDVDAEQASLRNKRATSTYGDKDMA
ncbi:aquaporin-like protein [Hortaea werneckii]|nr:aquaporin-like protein [Hortaea werneckii]